MGRPAGWMTELTGRAAMKSPGKPSLRRDVERLFWREVARGLSSDEAARAVGASQAAGSRWFRDRGGMATFMLVPLSGRYLSFEEREEIALLRAQGIGVREIARRLGRAPSTISRELRRNAATRGSKLEYRASVAQWKAELMARRPKTAKLVADDRLREYVQDRLAGLVRLPDGTAVSGPATARIHPVVAPLSPGVACRSLSFLEGAVVVDRFGLSLVEQERVWDLWRTGLSLRAVARVMGQRPQRVLRYVWSTGGKRPLPRRRAACCLSPAEREEISRGLAAGRSCRGIAAGLGRSHVDMSSTEARSAGWRRPNLSE